MIFLYRNQSSFYNFVNAISAKGGVGGDTAEDVMGGLQAAFSRLSWGDKEVCKVNFYPYYYLRKTVVVNQDTS